MTWTVTRFEVRKGRAKFLNHEPVESAIVADWRHVYGPVFGVVGVWHIVIDEPHLFVMTFVGNPAHIWVCRSNEKGKA